MWRSVLSIAALSLCLLIAWAFVYLFAISDVQHARKQHEMYATYRADLAQALAPVGGAIPVGTSVAIISIPKAGLHNEIVVEGTSSDQTRNGPGHLRSSPLPGQAGSSALYGRSAFFGAPFARVPNLRPGDAISVTTGQGHFTYNVSDVRGSGDPLPPPLVAGAGRLTLVTSQGVGWRTGWAPTDTVFVDAILVGKPAPTPAGRPEAVTPSETPMKAQTDLVTLTEIVLWLQLLVIVSCLIVWLAFRWDRLKLWLCALPVVLGVLWGLSVSASALLPNLM